MTRAVVTTYFVSFSPNVGLTMMKWASVHSIFISVAKYCRYEKYKEKNGGTKYARQTTSLLSAITNFIAHICDHLFENQNK